MTIPKNNSSKYNPKHQLALLRLQCKELSPKLYENNALYLQRIRSELPNAVRQAVFHLITDQKEYQEGISSLGSKTISLNKIDKLVSKALPLITIEHLMNVANTLEKEQNSKLKETQRNLINGLMGRSDQSIGLNNNYIDSIDLTYEPPLEDPSRIERGFLSSDIDLGGKFNFSSNNSNFDENLTPDNHDTLQESSKTQENKTLDNLKRFFFLSSESIFSKLPKEDILNQSEETLTDKTKEKRNSEPNFLEDFSDSNFLPDNPLDLYKWMASLEIALIRSLRNLSNSINVELLTAGFINNLMPVTLLDAAINGQINYEDAPSNLLKINLPIDNTYPDEGIEVSCLLLRPSELEFDSPNLRKSRSSLKQYRSILGKMVRQHRHWQNRSLADEVSQQWLKTPLKTNRIKKSID